MVKDTGAGVVVAPDDTKGFIKGAHALMEDQEMRAIMADRSRTYAETHFDINKITDRFEKILLRLSV